MLHLLRSGPSRPNGKAFITSGFGALLTQWMGVPCETAVGLLVGPCLVVHEGPSAVQEVQPFLRPGGPEGPKAEGHGGNVPQRRVYGPWS
jgi:hypothetical protein